MSTHSSLSLIYTTKTSKNVHVCRNTTNHVMMQRLPVELQAHIVSLLDHHDVVALTRTNAFTHLFTVVSNLGRESRMRISRKVRRISIRDYDKTVDSTLVTLVELEVRAYTDIDELYSKLSLSTNFIFVYKFHDPKASRYSGDIESRTDDDYTNKKSLSYMMGTLPPRSRLLLRGLKNVYFHVPPKTDLSRITIENSEQVVYAGRNGGAPPRFRDVIRLKLPESADLNPLNGMDLSKSPNGALIVRSSQHHFPFIMDSKRNIKAYQVCLGPVLRLENVTSNAVELILDMWGSVLQQTAVIRSIQAPNLEELSIVTNTRIVSENLDMPALRSFSIKALGVPRVAIDLSFLRELNLSQLRRLDVSNDISTAEFFTAHRDEFKSLTFLSFHVDDAHMTNCSLQEESGGYGYFPSLGRVSVHGKIEYDNHTHQMWAPFFNAPNLSELALRIHIGEGIDEDLLETGNFRKALASFKDLQTLKLRLWGSILPEAHLSGMLEPMFDNLVSLQLSGVGLGFFSDYQRVKFLNLQHLLFSGDTSPRDQKVLLHFEAPLLKNLCINGWNTVSSVDIVGFPKLEDLRVTRMPLLSSLCLSNTPSLAVLKVSCPTLEVIRIDSESNLQVLKCASTDFLSGIEEGDIPHTLKLEGQWPDPVRTTSLGLDANHVYFMAERTLDWPMGADKSNMFQVTSLFDFM